MKRLVDQTLYEILEIREDAAAPEIASACDRAMALYGPGSLATYSLMSPEEAELLTRRIEQARTTLLDTEARARYDEELQRRPAAPAAVNGGATPAAELPPVIPAMRLSPLAGRDDDEEDAEREDGDEGEADGEPERAADREERPEAPPPGATPIPLVAAAAPPPEAPPRPAPIPLRKEIVTAAAPPAAAAPSAPPAPAPARAPARPAPQVPEGGPWTGEVLRQVREGRGLSLQQMAERTKVTRHHLENIEGDRFGALPAAVYLRGILLAVARELRLDGQKVARSYLERVAAAKR